MVRLQAEFMILSVPLYVLVVWSSWWPALLVAPSGSFRLLAAPFGF